MSLSTISILILFNITVNAQYSENIIKAAYIERITHFVEWPAKNSIISLDTIVIGVFGEKEFYATLKKVYKDKRIKDRKVSIIPIKSPGQMSTCNICYISKNAKPLINNFVTAASASGVLLFSGTTDFSKAGVHINFYLEHENLKFEINEKSMDSAGFKVSYLLMQNTRIIQ